MVIDLSGGSLGAVLLMGLAAVVIGFSKTALGGPAVISVAIFATILPAKESTVAILVLLIVGDLVAVWHYRHDADWSLIRRLLPAVPQGSCSGLSSSGSCPTTSLGRCWEEGLPQIETRTYSFRAYRLSRVLPVRHGKTAWHRLLPDPAQRLAGFHPRLRCKRATHRIVHRTGVRRRERGGARRMPVFESWLTQQTRTEFRATSPVPPVP